MKTKLTKTGCRITKNGSILTSIEKDAIQKDYYDGSLIKENGTYYFFDRNQNGIYIYLS